MRQLVIIATVLIGATSVRAETETLNLTTGQQKIISVPGVTRIAVANPNVADVKVVDAGQVLVTAVGAGQTELTVWRGTKVSSYDVRVTSLDPRQIKREVEKLLEGREAIKVRTVKDTVVLEGNVLTLADIEKADEVVQIYPQVRNLVKLDPSAHAHIAEAINKELSSAGLVNARANVVGATIFLEGMVDTQADLQKAEIITRAIAKNVQSVLRIGASRMVELDVEFVEISKKSLDRIGIRWPTDINGTLQLDYSRTTVLTGASRPDVEFLTGGASATASLGLALQFTDGVSRTLARPRLVTASAVEARFLAGGEVPIPIVTQNQVHIEYKEYGIRLKITPVAEGSGAIQTKILAEISDVDPSVTVMGVPGFISRRVDTEVTVKDGETIVLSGLLHVAEGKDITKVPILGHVPIVGELFKSRQFQDKQTELAVFVTPRLIDPLSQRVKELSGHMRKRYEEAGSDVGFSLFD
ncbi:MAG: pilus assembly protein N-terminal domain-containing protein [Deltaproteobacteria bacterium]|nr:pilus assembly protein N-terminal domain-containing protein [Deltaproteobacteria bacterium]